MPRYPEWSPNRRDYLTATAATVAGIGMAGCLENDTNGDGTAGDSDQQDNSNDDDEASSGDADDFPTIEGFSASDIRRDDDEQRITVSLSNVEPGEEVDVYVDVTSLTEASMGVDDFGCVSESPRPGWSVTDEELIVDEQILFRVTATVESDEDYVEDIGNIRMELFRLGTETVEHMSDLQHYATLSPADEEPDFENADTATYDVIDPAELENLLAIAPQDIRAGDTEQEVFREIGHATSEIDLGIDINPITEAGVDIDDAGVVVDMVGGGDRNEETVEVISASITDGVVRIHFEVEAESIAFEFEITNLETDDVERTEDITYPIFTGERPPDPQRSRPFEISGVTA